MKKFFYFIVVSTLLVTSCAKEKEMVEERGKEEENLVETFLRVNGGKSRTTLDGTTVSWEKGDKLSVLDKNGNNYTFTAAEDGSSAAFVGYVPVGASIEGWVAYFAYNAGAKYDGTTVSAPVPHTVYAAGNKIYGRMVGIIGSGNTVAMKQVGGLVKFEITTSDISSVTLIGNKGEHLSGKFNLTFTDGGVPETATPAFSNDNRQEQYSSVVMLPSKGTAAFVPGTYYMPVPETEFEDGVKFRFTRTSDNLYSEKDFDLEDIERKRIALLGPVDTGLEWSVQVHFSVADFKDSAKNLVWPFTESRTKYDTPNVEKEYITKAEGYAFKIRLSDNGDTWGAIVTDAQGLKFGNSAEDYLELPVIEGQVLKKIVLTSGSAKNKSTLYIQNAATGTKVPGSGWTNTVGRGTVKVWDNLNGTVTDRFRIMHEDGHYCCIQKLDLYYETGSISTVKMCEFVSAEGAAGTAVIRGEKPADESFSEYGFDYRVYGSSGWTSVSGATLDGNTFSSTLNGLTANERYEYCAWAKKTSGSEKQYGAVCTFTLSDGDGKVSLVFTLADSATPENKTYYDRLVPVYIPVVSNEGPKTGDFSLPADKGQVLSFSVSTLASRGWGYRAVGSPKNYYGICLSYDTESETEGRRSYLKLPVNPFSGWGLCGLNAGFVEKSSVYNISSSVDANLNGDEYYKESSTSSSSKKYDESGDIEINDAGDVYLCGTSRLFTIWKLKLVYKVGSGQGTDTGETEE